MLVLQKRLLDTPIMSLQTGGEIARTEQPIIDPRKLMILAFYCQGNQLDFKPAIVHTIDLREFSEIGLIVDDSDVLMPAKELIRLKEVLDLKFELLGKRVVDQSGQKLGKVTDYVVDIDSYYIVKLYVAPTLINSLFDSELVIDRTQIKEVNDKFVIVKKSTDAKRATYQGASANFDNPFRKTKPQINAG